MLAILHSPIVWLAAGLIFLALETLIWNRLFLWLALVSLAFGILLFYTPIPSWQLAYGWVGAMLLGVLTRRRGKRRKPVRNGPDFGAGAEGTVVETIRGQGQSGAVQVNGSVWIAFADERITVGLPIVVVRKEKNGVRVQKAEA